MFNCPEPNVSHYFRWKRSIDLPIALLLSVVALPVIALAYVLVRLTSQGPGIYKQVRLGLDGKPFTMYKIRTMWSNAEAATGAIWTARGDKRITVIGKILRRTHLDELPQLYNILRGDMALVGPRPERPEFVAELERRIDGYGYRLYVMPGWTGLAQLNQPPDVDLNDVRRKLVFDFEYIEGASPLFDIRLLCCSVFKTLCLCKPAVLSFFRVNRKAEKSRWVTSLPLATYATPEDEEHLSRILSKQSMV
jgi:lipopolysaccharide/colanic/teichoic acid biosynthesis glycosyltransferase